MLKQDRGKIFNFCYHSFVLCLLVEMPEGEVKRGDFNAFRATVAATIRKEIKTETAEEFNAIVDNKRRQDFLKAIENEVNKRARVAWVAAGDAPLPVSAEILDKDIGYCGHGLDVYKSLSRGRLRREVQGKDPKLKAKAVDKLVLTKARAEFKQLPNDKKCIWNWRHAPL